MTEKDWMIFIIPIVFEGDFIFLLQIYLKKYFEKRKEYVSRKT